MEVILSQQAKGWKQSMCMRLKLQHIVQKGRYRDETFRYQPWVSDIKQKSSSCRSDYVNARVKGYLETVAMWFIDTKVENVNFPPTRFIARVS